ncbi:MAG: Rne/Rng family ribonuclease [Planctomycetes bacterium]|nr:Rne/Rng family ribonuclease [Planctomycetota bacterium]
MVSKPKSAPVEVMVVNDSPGEECRIAILEDHHLEELYSERSATATNVGNIYKGRVVNVEPAIQAAFIDYGEGANGFLHISDLHPRYFPGKERTERVGRKIPRRERPPIQDALRRGDEVLVQVLKEGIGTKGPTLTSYLSIPGRMIVMMPEMDRVGVSRKVEDEEGRREMRKVLDGLDLPEGFGFILRTAGVGRTKTELKRDVAYLTRLWKVMEKRIKTVGAPCELYTESDLLIRTVRDVLRPTISAIVVDSESAHDRVMQFLQVVAPRSAPKVVRYHRSAPIFHTFDIERQIDLIHSREVPLKSGGRLVIDQTEALVAIDVNSGRSRSARDSETNAFNTNCEAVDEICRQLRLRDLGGLIIHDLIDMRASKNRRLIEMRFHENLKRDRAKSTTLRISEFGLVEMTRQRMRPSMRKSHFVTCPRCAGHGEIKAAESVAADVVRHCGFLLDHDRVQRIEIVCSPRVASVLLSRKRRELVRLEDLTGRTIDVRVSDDIAADRVDYYAYDGRNADIDVSHLPGPKRPTLKELESEHQAAERAEPESDERSGDPGQRKRRRRRRSGPADATAIALAGGFEDLEEDETEEEEESTGRRRKSRSRRRRRKPAEEQTEAAEAAPETDAETPAEESAPKRRRRGGRGRRRKETPAAAEASAEPVAEPVVEPVAEPVVEGPDRRIHELAKELGCKSRELLERCREEGSIEVKGYMSRVTAAQAAVIVGWFSEDSEAAAVVEAATEAEASAETEASEERPRRRRRRRGGRGRSRRGRGGGRGAEGDTESESGAEPATEARSDAPSAAKDESPAADTEVGEKKEGTRKKRSRRKKKTTTAAASDSSTTDTRDPADETPKDTKKKSRRRKKTSARSGADKPETPEPPVIEAVSEPAAPRRTLYGGRRKLTRTAALDAAGDMD